MAKKMKQVKIECMFIWESPQTILLEDASKAAAIRKLKKEFANGHSSPDVIKIKNIEFV